MVPREVCDVAQRWKFGKSVSSEISLPLIYSQCTSCLVNPKVEDFDIGEWLPEHWIKIMMLYELLTWNSGNNHVCERDIAHFVDNKVRNPGHVHIFIYLWFAETLPANIWAWCLGCKWMEVKRYPQISYFSDYSTYLILENPFNHCGALKPMRCAHSFVVTLFTFKAMLKWILLLSEHFKSPTSTPVSTCWLGVFTSSEGSCHCHSLLFRHWLIGHLIDYQSISICN